MLWKLSIPVIGLVISASAALAGEKTVTLSVPRMFCASCPYVVQAAIDAVDGVRSVVTDLKSRTAVVVFDDERAGLDDITAATRQAGYESTPVKDGPKS